MARGQLIGCHVFIWSHSCFGININGFFLLIWFGLVQEQIWQWKKQKNTRAIYKKQSNGKKKTAKGKQWQWMNFVMMQPKIKHSHSSNLCDHIKAFFSCSAHIHLFESRRLYRKPTHTHVAQFSLAKGVSTPFYKP